MNLDRALALDDAGVAGVALLKDGLGERRPVDVLGQLEGALVVVARRQAADLVLDREHAGRPVLAQPDYPRVRRLEILQPLDEAAAAHRLPLLRRLAPPHPHRLYPLRSH